MTFDTGFARKHPRGVITTRVVVAVWLLVLSGILLAELKPAWLGRHQSQ